jgi:hypothetical protein
VAAAPRQEQQRALGSVHRFRHAGVGASDQLRGSIASPPKKARAYGASSVAAPGQRFPHEYLEDLLGTLQAVWDRFGHRSDCEREDTDSKRSELDGELPRDCLDRVEGDVRSSQVVVARRAAAVAGPTEGVTPERRASSRPGQLRNASSAPLPEDRRSPHVLRHRRCWPTASTA